MTLLIEGLQDTKLTFVNLDQTFEEPSQMLDLSRTNRTAAVMGQNPHGFSSSMLILPLRVKEDKAGKFVFFFKHIQGLLETYMLKA